MMGAMRQYMLPLGLIAGLLTPTAAVAGEKDSGSNSKEHRIHWEGPSGDKPGRWEPDICTVEVKKCQEKKVWYDKQGRKHTRQAKCWVEEKPYYC